MLLKFTAKNRLIGEAKFAITLANGVTCKSTWINGSTPLPTDTYFEIPFNVPENFAKNEEIFTCKVEYEDELGTKYSKYCIAFNTRKDNIYKFIQVGPFLLNDIPVRLTD